MKTAKQIQCGELVVRENFRITVGRQCKAHGIKEGDLVRVFLEKMEA